MFSNLRAELTRHGLSTKQYASIIGVTEKTVQNKLNGKTEFTLSEIKATIEYFHLDSHYLFGIG